MEILKRWERISREVLSDYELARKQCREEAAAKGQAAEDVVVIEEVQALLQTIAADVQNKAHERITQVVSRCLKAVFPDPYEFRISFEKKRGKTEARLSFVRNGEEYEPLESSGGGVVDVAAFALRVACLVLSRPKKRRLLVLDEPFKFLSSQYNDKAREMILALSRELGIQFILVTHIQKLMIGKVVEIE